MPVGQAGEPELGSQNPREVIHSSLGLVTGKGAEAHRKTPRPARKTESISLKFSRDPASKTKQTKESDQERRTHVHTQAHMTTHTTQVHRKGRGIAVWPRPRIPALASRHPRASVSPLTTRGSCSEKGPQLGGEQISAEQHHPQRGSSRDYGDNGR